MQLLVEQAGEQGPALLVSAEKNTGRLATHVAAEYGRVEALAYLLQQGVGTAQVGARLSASAHVCVVCFVLRVVHHRQGRVLSVQAHSSPCGDGEQPASRSPVPAGPGRQGPFHLS
jgi:hypothetical protein